MLVGAFYKHLGLSATISRLTEFTVCIISHDRTPVRTVVMVIPILGSGPMNPSQAASLASLSAISLPGTLKYPGTQISLTLLNNDTRLSSVVVSATNFDVVLAVFSAFNAVCL